MGFIEIREQNMAVCAGVFGGGGGSVCVWGGVSLNKCNLLLISEDVI